MNPEKYTLHGVFNVIENEGIDYAVKDYLGPENIQDPVLAEMWKEAHNVLKILDKIDAYIESNHDPETCTMCKEEDED